MLGEAHEPRAGWSFNITSTRIIFQRVEFKCVVINNKVKEFGCKHGKDTDHLNVKKKHIDTPVLATPPG